MPRKSIGKVEPPVAAGAAQGGINASLAGSVGGAAGTAAALAASGHPRASIISSANNSVGRPLHDVWQPYSAPAEQLVPVRINLRGSELMPPLEGEDGAIHFEDFLLWNVHESSFRPEAFGKLTCEEEGLPPTFAKAIAQTINDAIERHSFSADDEVASAPPGEHTVALDIVAEGGGLVVQDRVRWDICDSAQVDFPPETYAEELCTALQLPADMALPIAVAMREQISTARRDAEEYELLPYTAEMDVDDDGRQETVVLSEVDAVHWTPLVALASEGHGLAAKQRADMVREAEQRDRHRRVSNGEGTIMMMQ